MNFERATHESLAADVWLLKRFGALSIVHFLHAGKSQYAVSVWWL